MASKDLSELFLHQLKDTYFAEQAISKALPKMAEAAQSNELRGAFAVHLEETKTQIQRLNKFLSSLVKNLRAWNARRSWASLPRERR